LSGLAGAVVMALCWCVLPAGAGSADGAAGITRITLERDCNGCPSGWMLVLARDGSARLNIAGKARLGTADQSLAGQVSAQDFDALARVAVGQGYFSYAESYQDPDLQDGPWAATGVTAGGVEKRVFRRNDAGPPALIAFEAAIEALKQRIVFKPVAP
jgi:hypothetical protein